MRLFIEAVLDESALDAAWTAGQRLANDSAIPLRSVRWVRREAFHLTLRFLGELDEDKVPVISRSLRALEGTGGFELRLDRMGSFGGRRPRVLWIGIADDDGLERLRSLRDQLDNSLAALGLSPGGEVFRPHLTLGRVRRAASPEDLAAIREALRGAGPLRIGATVERVALVHSTLLTDGPRYQRAATADL